MDLEEYIEVPTVFPAADFDAVADAHALRKAMKGFGTDEQVIIDILTKRSNAQRQAIAQAYKNEFGRGDGEKKKEKDLIEDLKKELGGVFEDVIVGLMLPTAKYCAKQIHAAISGVGTDESLLVEMICPRSPSELRQIAQAYEKKYGQGLEEAVAGDTSGDFQRLMVLIIQGVKDENTADVEAAKDQAALLYNAGEGTIGTDEEVFVNLFGHCGQRQLFLVFEEYKHISGRTIEQALEEEFSGELKKGLLAIVKCVHNRPRYFAEKIHKAMDGAGTDDAALIRIIVSRSEMDLGNIKAEYERDHGVTLLSAIKNETSGDFKRALASIIGDA